ncbi:ATP-dependent RNA helicase [Nocardia asteroides]|uniref:ATP-dependent RNA helicase n=1 Tax=Nocardia asteroides NBRC 15531 TaxID=1110697 RepID=U5E8V3_NOCAS|nr:ATP-dependent helicase C-terminal domain-containing protein [Nocardia asteroides]UGT47939.1 ATP-dependent helicase [Nocardia asteroides]GAD82908.1 putative ATP-dependent RNA helicase [Nocardia asteroides NBRC 15531]SFM59930.1 ATP-dependent helicase HrpB [Nocardia asteroides]VEG33126.1 ATP-dependent RNA helicase HrpB [Nocardia asteroides]
MKLPELPDLPVRSALGGIVETLVERGVAVLVAPPGTGKTTLVPLALAAGTEGRVVVAEPRRLAARAAAARMAALLGERVGETVGYAVRGDRKVGPRTRIEVVTSGLLVRRLQRDPELAGVGTVVLDECHERHLDADLLLALLLDARSGLRPDLRVLATSATVAADRLAQLLAVGEPDAPSGRAPVLEVRGRAYPVAFDYLPALPRERVEAQVARAVRAALAGGDGDVLVFLPGVGEINRTAGLLRDLDDVDVLPLHGRLAAAAQDSALRAGARRRVVLSTAVAESSLTVPGVRAVVDSGLARVPRIDHRRGLSGLATVRVSAAVAEQRAGRAGREGPGHAWRCWPEYEHQTLPAYPEPEIRTAELTRLALELACWGTPDGSGLSWWDAPPEGGLAAGRAVLRALGALDNTDTVTDRGRAMAALGLHPRLARALLDGAREVGPRAAAEMVALMDDDSLASGVDAAAALRTLRAERPQRWTREVRRLADLVAAHLPREIGGTPADSAQVRELAAHELERAGNSGPPSEPAASDNSGAQGPGRVGSAVGAGQGVGAADVGRGMATADGDSGPSVGDRVGGRADSAALMIALAYPERLARRRTSGQSYLMAGGTAVTLPPGSGLGAAEWLAVAVADRDPGRAEGRIRLAAIADEELARAAAPGLVVSAEEVRWESGDVVARRVERLGAIILTEKPLREPDSALLQEALQEGLRSEGLELLRWDDDARSLRQRLDFLHRILGAPWPAVDDDALLADLDPWLGPELTIARRRTDLTRIDAGTALRRLLPWPEAARLDELAPERLEVPSGSRVRLDYTADPPVLAVKVQEIFGWSTPPTLADGRAPILLHLLSPAQRPVAVTADLPSFWKNGWPQVRADLRGRYPKHSWPEDPTTVTAHRGTARNATKPAR